MNYSKHSMISTPKAITACFRFSTAVLSVHVRELDSATSK